MSEIKQVLMSERPAALPAPAGLGNYKGVMLCNRPDACASTRMGPPPFKPTVAETFNQPLGLNPVNQGVPFEAEPAATSIIIKRHGEWLKRLQEDMKRSKLEAIDKRAQEAAKVESFKKMAARQREGVRKLMEQRKQMTQEEFRGNLAEAVEAPDLSKVPVMEKPLWAMSQDEKQEFDLHEADALIDFADELDFDQYIHDLEFREALETLQARANKIDEEQKAFKSELVKALNEEENESRPDDTGCATSVKQSRANPQESDWDASTTVGEKREEDPELRSQAEKVLATNSEIRSVHSKDSVKKIIENQKQQKELKKAQAMETPLSSPLAAGILKLAETASPPNPTIISHESKKKTEPDPSMLPYLYRSPAI